MVQSENSLRAAVRSVLSRALFLFERRSRAKEREGGGRERRGGEVRLLINLKAALKRDRGS